MKCPKCKARIPDAAVQREAARLRGLVTSPAKARSSAKNGRLSKRVKWGVWNGQELRAGNLSRGCAWAVLRKFREAGLTVDSKPKVER